MLYERYINGETESVYSEIEMLGADAFSEAYRHDVERVLTETFERVQYNLNIIYRELVKINYRFNSDFRYNFERPLVEPLGNTAELLTKLENAVNPYGFVPHSLKMFYRITGACNFAWDYSTHKDFIWRCADPIQIVSLDDLVSQVTEHDYLEELQQELEATGLVSLPLAADYLHKDNISGGETYSIQLTGMPSIDGQFLNEEHNTTFINYLRICFENCGFPRIGQENDINTYLQYFNTVKPLLKKI